MSATITTGSLAAVSVAIVTDSTAYLPADMVQRHHIRVVPIHVVVGGRELAEGVDVTPQIVADALRSYTPVTTARPSPQAMLAAYEAAAADGATAVVSVHLSSDMSSTIGSAELAAREASVPVQVVDSRSVAMGLGYAVLAGARAAQAQAGPEQVVRVVRQRAGASTVRFSVDTLEFLRRGGRIGAASTLVGTALAIKPILGLIDGAIVPLERVRTTSRAVARLEDLAFESATRLPAGATGCDLAVHHVDSPDRAAALADRLAARVPGVSSVPVIELGAVVGAHVGPGTLGTVVSPRFDDLR